MQIDYYSLPIEGLTARAIGAGRDIAAAIRSSDLAHDPHKTAFLDRCLAGLPRGEPLDPRDTGGLETIRTMLEREIAKETLGTARVFFGVCDPEEGDVGTVRELPVVSERGAALDALLEDFEGFLDMRQVLLDRLNAERVVADAGRA